MNFWILWVIENRDKKRFRSKLLYVLLEKFFRKINFRKFTWTFYDDVVNTDHINGSKHLKKLCLWSEVDVGHICELFCCKIFSRKLRKLKGVHESFPTAGLSDSFSVPGDAIGGVISRKSLTSFGYPIHLYFNLI